MNGVACYFLSFFLSVVCLNNGGLWRINTGSIYSLCCHRKYTFDALCPKSLSGFITHSCETGEKMQYFSNCRVCVYKMEEGKL